MEKIKCPKCGKMNSIEREYCWLCAYKISDVNEFFSESTKEETKQRKNSNKATILFLIWSVFILLGMLFMMESFEAGVFLFLASSIVFLPFCCYFWYETQKSKDRINGTVFQTEIYVKYFSGIDNMVSNANCKLKFSKDVGLTIEDIAINKKYNLKYEKITNIGIMSEEKIKEYYKSAGGALGKIALGNLFLGEVGMLAGLSAANNIKRVENKEIHQFLIINYKKNETIQIIVFEIKSNIRELKKIIDEINYEHKFIKESFEEL